MGAFYTGLLETVLSQTRWMFLILSLPFSFSFALEKSHAILGVTVYGWLIPQQTLC